MFTTYSAADVLSNLYCGSALMVHGDSLSERTARHADALSRNCVYNFVPATGHREFLLSSRDPISVAVVGVGVFGRNHARVYRELEQQGEAVRLLGVVDSDVNRADAVAREFACKAFGSVEQLLTTHSEVQAASVAAPTMHHLAVARDLMKAGVDVLIEKPLAATLADAEELVGLAAKHKRIAQVGHLERFNPAVRATLPILTRPMFFEVHRLSVFTPRSLDVDVVLDLMIHDLDIVLAFAKSTVKEVRAVGLPILSGKVDIANVRLELESGCIANFTASRVSTERVRKLRFFQPRQYVSLDYGRQEVLVFTVGEDGTRGAPSVNPQIGVVKPPVASEEPLHAELKSFLHAVAERSAPVVPLEDGRRSLALALEIVAAIRDHSKKIDLAGMAKIKN
ncbi:MAG TPA: Gfo/Idh/MocA family oxidoreductase [Candidatus Acidoferrum sp.]|nr:Gfo/Idh/MocA family oxidoreductase [Candidatus Acidoferrum sp.]